jgi:hypothetical protein
LENDYTESEGIGAAPPEPEKEERADADRSSAPQNSGRNSACGFAQFSYFVRLVFHVSIVSCNKSTTWLMGSEY